MQDASRNPPRPPVSGWLGLLFGLGPTVLAAAVLAVTFSGPQPLPGLVIGALFYGVIGGTCFSSGLVLASRFYSGTRARILGGLAAGLLAVLVFVAMLFAGCKCLTLRGMAVVGAR